MRLEVPHDGVMKGEGWTPYREIMRYRRLLVLSVLLNLLLTAALINCWR